MSAAACGRDSIGSLSGAYAYALVWKNPVKSANAPMAICAAKFTGGIILCPKTYNKITLTNTS